MKALTLWQPAATLTAEGVKTVTSNRSTRRSPQRDGKACGRGTPRRNPMSMQRIREPGVGYPRRTGIGPWARDAACRRPGAPDMHPVDTAGRFAALRCCGRCPVAEECLEHALDQRERHGVWGGKTEEQRSRILRSRRRQGDDLRERVG